MPGALEEGMQSGHCTGSWAAGTVCAGLEYLVGK